jgi:glycosyltransferase involved in cell wall biosynthesis
MNMRMSKVAEEPPAKEVEASAPAMSNLPLGIEIGLLTGGRDRPYAFGLTMALVSRGVYLDIIGSDEIDSPELHVTPNLRFLNFRGSQRNNANVMKKLSKLLVYYAKLIRYAARSKPKILHILWNNKFEYFDRTILMLYFKFLGKKIALTAHNVNAGKRDSDDSLLNRITLKIQYRLCDHIFVHTQKMKSELCQDFGVAERAVTVISYPIDNAFPDTELTAAEAKLRLGLKENERTILFFGKIRPYKGIEFLLDAFRLLLVDEHANYRLVIAGEPTKESKEYLQKIQQSVSRDFNQGQVILRSQFIPDDEMEMYLKGADVLVLPYKEIFQSGVLFLSYSFGLPVVATDVGSFREEIVEGCTGFLCKPSDSFELAKAIETYFVSDLFKNLTGRRREIKKYANANHSSHAAAELTSDTYARMLGRMRS